MLNKHYFFWHSYTLFDGYEENNYDNNLTFYAFKNMGHKC